jgi:hypothetical protein
MGILGRELPAESIARSEEVNAEKYAPTLGTSTTATNAREPDAIYQNGRVVAGGRQGASF